MGKLIISMALGVLLLTGCGARKPYSVYDTKDEKVTMSVFVDVPEGASKPSLELWGEQISREYGTNGQPVTVHFHDGNHETAGWIAFYKSGFLTYVRD